MQKKDKLLIMYVIIAAVILFIIFSFLQRYEGEKASIFIDGILYDEYSLNENQIITIDGLLGYNQITIENGTIFMSGADCPDKYCMDYKPISKANETIVCLPHKLVIEIKGNKNKQNMDVIVQ